MGGYLPIVSDIQLSGGLLALSKWMGTYSIQLADLLHLLLYTVLLFEANDFLFFIFFRTKLKCTQLQGEE